MTDFEEWRAIPATREYLRTLDATIDALQTDMGRLAKTIDINSMEATALKTARMVGRIEGLMEAQEIAS